MTHMEEISGYEGEKLISTYSYIISLGTPRPDMTPHAYQSSFHKKDSFILATNETDIPGV